MTRTMFDAVNIDNIPENWPMVASYYNGLYAVNEHAYVARFPNSVRIHIDVLGNAPHEAAVRDWETGDKGGNLENWVFDRKVFRQDAVVYCNRATIAEVRRLTGSQRLGKDYWLWVATLDGSEYRGGTNGVKSSDVVACQTHTVSSGNTELYDVSKVYADWWHSAT